MLSIVLSTLLAATQEPIPIKVDGDVCSANRLMVQISGSLGEGSIRNAGYQIIARHPLINYVTVQVPENEVKAAQIALTGKPGIVRADLDYAKQPAYVPNDPFWPNQWHMRTIKADTAWDLTFGIPTVVAVIDSGVEVTHPDLIGNLWTNIHEIPANGIDDDLNGYIDDINGFDFVALDGTIEDTNGHGTACAGIVGAVQDNAIGVTGVAPNARIMGLKALNNSGLLFDSYLVPAYFYAAANGAKVLSMSYFSDRVSNAERLALDYCWRRNVLPIAAAGNDNTIYPYYPAAYENVVSVAATDPNNQRASFSDYGTWVDVAAPGVSLWTTSIGNNYTGGFGGTSGACPHVAGLATLLFGTRENLTNAQVRAAIEDWATPVSQDFIGEYCNYGLINAYASVLAIQTGATNVREAVVRYVTPGNAEAKPSASPTAIRPPTRIYGRSFMPPNNVVVMLGTTNVPIVTRTRDYIDVNLPVGTGTLIVTVNGIRKFSSAITSAAQVKYGAVEAGTKGANLTEGNYLRMINADNIFATCTARGDGRIYLQSTFRLVRATPASAVNGSSLTIRRRYRNAAGATERIYLYDWSSGSFPYGNFIQINSQAAPSAMTTSTFNLTNLPRFIDFEGTVYAFVETTGVTGDSTLELDQLVLNKPRT
ncbi:MAG: S8 family serine peptidase [Fimbriimonadaceae bacterium]|nr:S8 family serine peptidase [Fimbriimonadaceae bacterium]